MAEEQLVEPEELLIPTFEIASNPTIKLNEIRAKRFYIVDRAQVKEVKVERVVEPIIEIDDWISPDYWPEWRITYHDREVIVQAPTKEEARMRADNDIRS